MTKIDKKTYATLAVGRLELLQAVHVVVDQAEASGGATTEGGAESEHNGSVRLGTVHLGNLLAQVFFRIESFAECCQAGVAQNGNAHLIVLLASIANRNLNAVDIGICGPLASRRKFLKFTCYMKKLFNVLNHVFQLF